MGKDGLMPNPDYGANIPLRRSAADFEVFSV